MNKIIILAAALLAAGCHPSCKGTDQNGRNSPAAHQYGEWSINTNAIYVFSSDSVVARTRQQCGPKEYQ